MLSGVIETDALVQPFEQWLSQVSSFEGVRVTRIEVAEGGASNLTCRVEVEGVPATSLCLRIQRERGIFEPYDVIREGKVLKCLQDSGLPVPHFVKMEPDAVVLGAPFVVLEWIEAPHMGAPDAVADFGEFTRAVVAVHQVDWRKAGLAFLLRDDTPQQTIRREIATIRGRMTAFGCGEDELLLRAADVLDRMAPGDGKLALCQGDINVFNYLFLDGMCVGIVDWEQARISDARGDVGHLLALSNLKGAPFGPADAMPFARGYGAASGNPLSGMAYFRARWLFELGVIYHGWTSLNDSEPWYSRGQVEELLGVALHELQEM